MLLSSRLRAMGAFADALTGPVRRVSELSFTVRPWDIDLNVHLTNGRYPQLMDAGRLHLLVSSGATSQLLRDRTRPIAVEQHLVFKRELGLGARFTLRTEVTGRDRKALVFTQRFLVGDRLHAEGTVNVVLLGPDGVVSPEAIQALLWDGTDGGTADQVQASPRRADQ